MLSLSKLGHVLRRDSESIKTTYFTEEDPKMKSTCCEFQSKMITVFYRNSIELCINASLKAVELKNINHIYLVIYFKDKTFDFFFTCIFHILSIYLIFCYS